MRFTSLYRQQRSHMFTQERANLVIWNLRNRAETTDTQGSNLPQAGEDAEEEGQTEDPLVEPNVHSPGQIEALLENMRREQNVALSNELWMGASQIQSEISTLIDATAGDNPEGLSTRVVRDIRNVFQQFSERTEIEDQMREWRGLESMLKTLPH